MIGGVGQRVAANASPANTTMAPLPSDTASELDMTAGASPNDNYELREMVTVATTYLNQGLVDDAEDLLHEALGAGYDRADAIELQDRLRRARGIMQTSTPATPTPVKPARPLLAEAHFTAPLHGAERLSAEVQRAI